MVDIVWLTTPGWESFPGLVHGFLGRQGGRSRPPYASLNLAYDVGDDVETVKDNWCDLKLAVGVHDFKIVTAEQIHGSTILAVTDGTRKSMGEADGMITDRPGVFLGVSTADCVSLLFIEPRRKIAAAIHAGWRGTAAGIAGKAVERLHEAYGILPSDLFVALGPSIGICCYEVGAEVYAAIREREGAECEKAWRAGRDGKGYLDLRLLNQMQLEAAGVPAARVQWVGLCNACHLDQFFSYRKEGKTGRQVSFVGWLT